jgi:TolA-binding protein
MQWKKERKSKFLPISTVLLLISASIAEAGSLQEQMQKLQKELSNASQQSNTLQLDFDLQISRYNQEITTLKRCLSKYQNQPSLQEKTEVLEARVQELEETLQARCSEIEENDDRFLE